MRLGLILEHGIHAYLKGKSAEIVDTMIARRINCVHTKTK